MISDQELVSLSKDLPLVEKKYIGKLAQLLKLLTAIDIDNREFKSKLKQATIAFNRYHASCAPGFIIDNTKQYIIDNYEVIYTRNIDSFFGSYKSKYKEELNDQMELIPLIDGLRPHINTLDKEEINEIFDTLEYMVDYAMIWNM